MNVYYKKIKIETSEKEMITICALMAFAIVVLVLSVDYLTANGHINTILNTLSE